MAPRAGRPASEPGLCAQGIKPEVRTYNTIINACNRAGLPESALQVYERMTADGAQPSATTYTALISAYGKTGQVVALLGSCAARCCVSACSQGACWCCLQQLAPPLLP